MATLTPEHIRALFAQEAQVRLASLDRLLLELERTPGDGALIQAIFRDLHTLKGSAAVVGLDDVSRSAHELEELIEDMRGGQRPATPDIVDALLAGVDRLAGLVAGRTPQSEARPGGPDLAESVVDSVAPPPAPRPVTGAAPSPRPPTGATPSPPPRSVDAAGSGVVMVSMERLDELVELLGEAAAAHLKIGRMLNDRFGVDPGSSTEFNDLSRSLNVLQDRAMRTRMVPVSTIVAGLHRAVRDIARAQGKDIHWHVDGADTELDRGVLHQLSDSLLHLVRNAADHGIEASDERAGHKSRQGHITLQARQLGSEVIISVSDDGGGIDLDRVRDRAARLGIDTTELSEEEILQLIFRSGLSTTSFVTDVSGRGVGLDVVHTNVEAARGRIEVRSVLGSGTEFRILVPITLAVLRCLVVDVSGRRFALPFHRVVLTQAHETSREISAEGRTVVWVEDQPVTVSSLAQTLGLPVGAADTGSIVVLTDSTRVHAFRVDRLVGQRDVALKGLSRLLPHLPVVAGASIEPDGSIFAVLDPPGLIQRAREHRRPVVVAAPAGPAERRRQRILVVDDALTVRELQRSILERAGFDVRLAIDGLQALSKLAEEPADLVLTDVDMPNMDGFALTAAIRAAPSLTNIPILILTSRSSDEDRQRGLDAGADGYIRKSGFDESGLLAAVHRLLGVAA